MFQRAFQHRSGRVVAVSRASLAAFFSLAVWVQPTEPAVSATDVRLLLLGYFLAALLLLRLTWDDWWLEARLAAPAHIFDMVLLTVLVGLTTGYSSPFFAIYVFLVISAAIRWGWKQAFATTLLGLVLYSIAGLLAAHAASSGIDVQRFILRAANLTVLSLMIIWFGINQFGPRLPASSSPLAEGGDLSSPPIRWSLAHVAKVLAARRLVFAWTDSEEPWLHIGRLEAGTFTEERLGPEVYPSLVPADLADRPFIFDAKAGKILTRSGTRRNTARRAEPIDPVFAEQFSVRSGLVIPVCAGAHQGFVFASAIPGLCSDDLPIAVKLGEDIVSAFERLALFMATQEAAESRARLLLARDLHDSVVQFQAGMALKLQGVRIAAGDSDVGRDIDELRQQLTQEQRDLRTLISALREPSPAAHPIDLGRRITTLCQRLERQWNVACATATHPAAITIEPALQHDVDQLIREAVANAVRHGGADHIAIHAALSEGGLELDVEDNGAGFPVKGEFDDSQLWENKLGPRSLQERVRSLGGSLMLRTSEKGSHLAIALPTSGVLK
jgi:signal transduction histidine kinase